MIPALLGVFRLEMESLCAGWLWRRAQYAVETQDEECAEGLRVFTISVRGD